MSGENRFEFLRDTLKTTRRAFLSAAFLVCQSPAALAGDDTPPVIFPPPKKMERAGEPFKLKNNYGYKIFAAPGEDPRRETAADILKDMPGGRFEGAANGTEKESPSSDALVILSAFENIALIRGYLDDSDIDFIRCCGSPQGYLLKTLRGENGGVTLLALGKGWAGALYAAVSAQKMLSCGQDGIRMANIKIYDWPDFKIRGCCMTAYRDGKTQYEKGKEDIDFCLKYKINMLQNDFAAPWAREKNISAYGDLPSPEKREWLKKLNEYAYAHGVEIRYFTTTGVGLYGKEKDNPDFKGCYLTRGEDYPSGGYYYCWGRDNLIQKRAGELARFVKDTNTVSMCFHAIDGGTSPFRETAACRARFKDDRAAGEANLINSFYKALKEASPNINLQFVVYPYFGNMDSPLNVKLREFYKSLSLGVPKDVFLSKTDFADPSSWNSVVPQRLVRHYNGTAGHAGLFFSTLSTYTKALYNPDRDDSYFLNEVLGGSGKAGTHTAVGTSYAWNTGADGSDEIKIDVNRSKPSYVVDSGIYVFPASIDGAPLYFWPISDGVRKPSAIAGGALSHICRERYGEAGDSFAEYFRIGIVRGITPLGGYSLVKRNLSGDFYKKITGAKWIDGQINKCREARRLLSGLFGSTGKLNGTARDEGMFFLKDTYVQEAYYTALLCAKDTNDLIEEEKYAVADSRLKELKAKINAIIDDGKKRGLLSADDIRIIKLRIEEILKPVTERVEVYLRMTGKSAAGTLKVGIYCPDGNGGSSGGAMGIFRFLNSSEGISARMISRVNRSRIKDYDCLIIPSVMKLGNDDTPAEMESALKWYVEELGRGVMFEHNSVGIERGGIKRSFFPDICGGAMKRVEDTALTVSSGRFLRAGSYKHIYFDHIALLKGGKGQVISTDKFNNPVHICGTEKKGRVLFSGTVTLAPDGDKELEEVSGFEAALLLSGVKWLCGDNG